MLADSMNHAPFYSSKGRSSAIGCCEGDIKVVKVASLVGYESAAAFDSTFKKRLASRRENIGNWPVNWPIDVAVNLDCDLWLSARPRFARWKYFTVRHS